MKKIVSVLLTLAVVLGFSLTMAVPAAVSADTYSYSQTWGTPPNTVGVVVQDTGDGWLQWTYTYPASPSHTPKMTVAINYPSGFCITTFDDGGHNGWYYAPDGGAVVRIGDYAGASYGGWVVTTAVDNVLTVKIKKTTLDDAGCTFMWHGYANVNGQQVWIEMNTNANPWAPTAKVTLNCDSTTVGGTVTGPSICVTAPSAIDFGIFASATNTQTAVTPGSVSVTLGSSGTANWQVTATDKWTGAGTGHMYNGAFLTNPLGISNGVTWTVAGGGGAWNGYGAGPLTYSGSGATGSLPFAAQQTIVAGDAVGSYSITIVFSGSVTP